MPSDGLCVNILLNSFSFSNYADIPTRFAVVVKCLLCVIWSVHYFGVLFPVVHFLIKLMEIII